MFLCFKKIDILKTFENWVKSESSRKKLKAADKKQMETEPVRDTKEKRRAARKEKSRSRTGLLFALRERVTINP